MVTRTVGTCSVPPRSVSNSPLRSGCRLPEVWLRSAEWGCVAWPGGAPAGSLPSTLQAPVPELRPREQASASQNCRTEEALVGVVRALGPFLAVWVPTPLRGAGVFS